MIVRGAVLSTSARLLLAGWLACNFCGGCQRTVAPVSGRVTLNGKPLSGAVVTFQPHPESRSSGPPTTGSVGRTDSDGCFSLRLIDPQQWGAAIGEHSVTISAATGGSDAAPAKGPLLPKAWRDGSKRFQVPPGGTREANFDISESETSGRSK